MTPQTPSPRFARLNPPRGDAGPRAPPPSTPTPSATSPPPPICCAPRARCSTRSSPPRSPVATGSHSSASRSFRALALARLVLIRLAEDAAGALLPAIGSRLDEILALAHRGGSASIDVGRGVQAVVEYGVLRFARASTAVAPEGEQALALPGTLRFGDWTLTAALGSAAALGATDPDHTAIFDADTLGTLSVRGWRVGDRMQPAGRSTTRGALGPLHRPPHPARAERVAIPLLDQRRARSPGCRASRSRSVSSPRPPPTASPCCAHSVRDGSPEYTAAAMVRSAAWRDASRGRGPAAADPRARR